MQFLGRFMYIMTFEMLYLHMCSHSEGIPTERPQSFVKIKLSLCSVLQQDPDSVL